MDIDIDFKTTFNPDDVFNNIVHASILENGKLQKHQAGVYFQNIPVDKETSLSAIPYDKSEDAGYTKIDLLHVSLLDKFASKAEIRRLIAKEPNWKLFQNKDIVSELFHIGNHFDIVDMVKPTSVLQLSDIMALIRPGKRHLLESYINSPEDSRMELYTKVTPSDMRKSHTIPYALLIVAQLNLMEENNEIPSE
jgi:hypothetical protein